MQLKFSYPRRGLTGQFNTFRLGARAGQQCSPGTELELVDSRSGKLIKRATVTAVFTGPLNEMAQQHAHQAHNWKDHEPEQRPALLMNSLAKRYPPNRVRDTSIVSVIYMQEIEI